jgi:hypothetical protein
MVEPGDKELLDAAAKADPYHAKAGLTGEHWEDRNTLVWADDHGLVVALRTSLVARVDLQFMSQDVERNARALLEGFWRYVSVMEKKGIEEIIFNTESPAVARFFVKRFGFRPVSASTFALRIK